MSIQNFNSVLYFDFLTGTQLVPNPSTPEGKLVQYWRQKFSEINIFLVTFGTIANPQLACEKLELPAAYTVTKEGVHVIFVHHWSFFRLRDQAELALLLCV